MVSWSNADDLILVMDEDYMQQMEEEYDRDYAFVQQWQQSFWFVMAAIGLLVVYLLAVAGRTGQDNELHLLFVWTAGPPRSCWGSRPSWLCC